MNNDKAIFEDWEMEKLNELVKYMSEMNLKETAEKEGHEKGFEKGIKKGIEKGREDSNREMIEKMLEENLDVELIMRVTNKSKDEIIHIKDSLDK